MPQVSEFVTGFGYGFSSGIALTVLAGLLLLIARVRRAQRAEARLTETQRDLLHALARVASTYRPPDTTLFESHPPGKPAEWPFPPGPHGFGSKKLTKQ